MCSCWGRDVLACALIWSGSHRLKQSRTLQTSAEEPHLMAEGCKHKSTLLRFFDHQSVSIITLSALPFSRRIPQFCGEREQERWMKESQGSEPGSVRDRESDAANVSYVRVKLLEWIWISSARRQVATLMSTRALLFVCFNLWCRTCVCVCGGGLGMFPALCLILMSCSFVFLWFCRIDRKKDKTERKILDSQERAFWDVHRPVVCEGWIQCGMGCCVCIFVWIELIK